MAASLRTTAAECARQWQLELGEPFAGGTQGLTLRASDAAGPSLVLKVSVPHRENEHEADALLRWGGGGAVRLLAHDRPRNALLLERCRPGTPLSELDAGAALDIAVGLLPRLWVPAGEPFRSLAEEAQWWSSFLPHRGYDPGLAAAALDAIAHLTASQAEQVLLHQDLHAGNILRAEREPWLAIDPKPLAGEREFGLAPLIRGDELGAGERAVRYRLDRLTAELGLDRDRARLWAGVQALAWDHPEKAGWLLED
jgi:streptomycin 6-kinase